MREIRLDRFLTGCRKLEIARALATQPKSVVAGRACCRDEPRRDTCSGALIILKIRKVQLTILLIEHDMSLVMTICERIIVLDHGVTIAEVFQRIQNNPDVITAYLGTGDLYA